LKVPYAKPPVGDLRWKPPQPPEPWSGVRHETEFASPCPQAKSELGEASEDEDCLYLNVWRPNENNRDSAVIVWIHGGGLTTGSAADLVPSSTDHLWYDGRIFAERQGVVVVTINYRLGAMGFFAHPALADEGSNVGNQGLLDQQQALKWVQANIEAFGGDPDNVTIAGESAGAGSVCMHLVAPGSRGLFHRAVGESGGCTTRRSTDREALNEQIEQWASERGCEGDNVLACLREKPVDEIVDMEQIVRTSGFESLRRSFSFGVVVDGEGGFLPEPARDLFDRGEVADVPYIIGTNTEEANLYFIGATVPASEEEFETEIRDRYGDFADRVLELYPLSMFDGNIRRTMARISTDSGMVCGSLDTARRAVDAGLTVYMYNFNVPWSLAPDLLGPSHASEISHVFGNPFIPAEQDPAVTSESQEVADVINAYWAAFAKTGDPNYDGAPTVWPVYAPDEDDNDQRLQLDADFEVLDSFRKEECQLWREIEESTL
jgi:para-nitrobenzyl esterase